MGCKHYDYVIALRGIGLVICLWGCLTRGPVQAADEATTLVMRALEQAREANDTERDRLIDEALAINPQHRLAHWLRGEIQVRNSWQTIEQAINETNQRLDRSGYDKERKSSDPNRIDSQIELADYCKKRNLVEQERAHLTRVLDLDSNHAAARNRLGFVRIGREWYSRKEIQDYATMRGKYSVAKSKWMPRLESIRTLFQSKDSDRHELGKTRLAAITDPLAIPFLEQRVATLGGDACLTVVDQLGSLPQHEATVALCRYAVLAPWSQINKQASGQLKRRSEDVVVPLLLSALHSPAETRTEIYTDPAGRLLVRQELFREEQEHKEQMVVTRTFETPTIDIDPLGAQARQKQLAEQTLAALEANAKARNEQIMAYNAKVVDTLAVVTNQEMPNEPLLWWDWWNDRREVYIEEEKPLDARSDNRTTVVLSANQIRVNELLRAERDRRDRDTGRRRGGGKDCLTAGTLVWTATGLKAIETMQLGDLVLSQNPTTGEIDFKPVLKTTIRPPSPTCAIKIDGEIIVASGGHPFWLADRGWQRIRNLTQGMKVGRFGGVAMIESTSDDATEIPTYNLIVADFHTYFIGKSKILSHDNTVSEPTATALPGLPLTVGASTSVSQEN